MPSFSFHKRVNGQNLTLGEARQDISQSHIDYTWEEDLATRTCYLFDMYHDPDPFLLRDVEPTDEMVPISLKYIISSSKTYEKDDVTYHIQMKHTQEVCVDYYEKVFEKRYGSIWPCGLYCLIPDAQGKYNRWLVVAPANYYDPLFPTFEVLPCDYTINYVADRKTWDIASVLRSQNSYNSGVWRDQMWSYIAVMLYVNSLNCWETLRAIK